MIHVSREEARFMLIQAGVKCANFDRRRNYEIETDLDQLAGEDIYDDDRRHLYVIAGWCPFNGIYCAWLHEAPRGVLEETIREVEVVRAVWEASRATGSSEYPDPDRHIDTLRRALEVIDRRERRAS